MSDINFVPSCGGCSKDIDDGEGWRYDSMFLLSFVKQIANVILQKDTFLHVNVCLGHDIRCNGLNM